MKALYVRKLFLWPRFQATVRSTLEDEVPVPADVGTLPPPPARTTFHRLTCPCASSQEYATLQKNDVDNGI